MHSAKITGCILIFIGFKNGKMNLSKPKVPTFNIRPARIIEPMVGASTCASGNHVWAGTIGILTINPIKKRVHAIP